MLTAFQLFITFCFLNVNYIYDYSLSVEIQLKSDDVTTVKHKLEANQE